MQSSKKSLIIFALICLSFEASAQYQFLRKGFTSSFDSSVNVEISEYRKIRAKVTLADSLVNALHAEINKSLQTIIKQDEQNRELSGLVVRHSNTIIAKDQTIQDLNKQYNALFKTASGRTKWYRSNAFKYGCGAVAALLARKGIIYLLQ